MNNIKIVLENGVVIPCKSFGKRKDVMGTFIFNTSLVGYQEVLTDPSYHKEIVVMTFPVQGIYGINKNDFESLSYGPLGFVVQEFEKNFSNNSAFKSLEKFLEEKNIQGAWDVDTRYLTKIIRNKGSLKGSIVSIDANEEKIIIQLKKTQLQKHVEEVSTKEKKVINPQGKKHVVFIDFGGKNAIIQNFVKRDFKVTKVPFDIKAEDILALKPDFVFLSNGPGDPSELTFTIKQLKKLIAKNIKICGICLGHQLLGLALNGKTFKLKFGHHSINHPILNKENNKVYITSQNHNYALDPNSLPSNVSSFLVSLHDKTIEGIKHKTKKLISVQFHPESCPGPNDANVLFDEFISFLLGGKNA